MNKIKINRKVLAILLSMGIVVSISGCRSNREKDTSSSAISVSEGVIVDSNTNANDDTSSVETFLPKKTFDYFSSDLEEVEGMIQMKELEQVKCKAKEVFITGVDFIFYGGSIKGVTFSELTEEGKKITMDNLESLGEMVDQVIPGWREELSDKYSVASEFVDDMYLSALDKIRGYLGDKNYAALDNIKTQLFSNAHQTYDNVKGHVKSWYEKFRSKK